MSVPIPAKWRHVLLIEDNPDDALLAVEALSEGGCRVSVVGDGVEAMAFLRVQGGAPTHAILLDLDLPRKTGLEVLREIKADRELRRIPVVIMTASDERAHLKEACNLQVSGYVTKPFTGPQLRHAIRCTGHAWFAAVLESLPDAVVVADADATVVLVNEQAERLFGAPRQDLIGRPIGRLVADLGGRRLPRAAGRVPRRLPPAAGPGRIRNRRPAGRRDRVSVAREPRPAGQRGGAAGRQHHARHQRAEADRGGPPAGPRRVGDRRPAAVGGVAQSVRRAAGAPQGDPPPGQEQPPTDLEHGPPAGPPGPAPEAGGGAGRGFVRRSPRPFEPGPAARRPRRDSEPYSVDGLGPRDALPVEFAVEHRLRRVLGETHRPFGEGMRIPRGDRPPSPGRPRPVRHRHGRAVQPDRNRADLEQLQARVPGRAAGAIVVGLRTCADGRFVLEVSDDGVGFPTALWAGDVGTLGLQLVGDLVADLEGTVELGRGPGATCRVAFTPLTRRS